MNPTGEDRWFEIQRIKPRARQFTVYLVNRGDGIDGVIAEVGGLPPVVATLGDGWFTMWYPFRGDWGYRLVGLDIARNEVAQIREP